MPDVNADDLPIDDTPTTDARALVVNDTAGTPELVQSAFVGAAGGTFTGAVVVPDATADTHAVNRQTGDARYAPLGATAVVAHGAAVRYARPTADVVVWVGTVEPDNAATGDIFVDVVGEPDESWYASFTGDSGIGVETTATAISTWDDISGNNRDVLQATEAKKPDWVAASGANPAHVSFDGAHALGVAFGETLAQPLTVLAVVRLDSTPTTGNEWIFDGEVNNEVTMGPSAGPVWTVTAGSVVTHDTAVPALDTWTLLVLYLNGASSTFRINGVEDSSFSPGAQTLTGLTLGGRYNETASAWLSGDIGDFRIKSGALDDEAAVEAWFADKYGITLP